MELGAPERVVEVRNVVEEEARAGSVGFNDESLILEAVKILLNFLDAGLGLQLDVGQGTRKGIFPPSRSLRVMRRSTSSGSAAWILSPAAVWKRMRASRSEMGLSPLLVTTRRTGITPWLR